MPIYAYKCESCGHSKDVLQKMSDAPLTQCPQCGADTFRKQVTAAGFQLKGSGWYVTDFRGGNTGAPPASQGSGESSGTSPSGSGNAGDTAASSAAGSASATPAPAPAASAAASPTPAPSSSGKDSS